MTTHMRFLVAIIAIATLFFELNPSIPSLAQNNSPLTGPIMMSNTPDLDAIVLIDLATGHQRRLSFGEGEHLAGTFSPDGCEILFTWERNHGQGHLYAASLDGQSIRQVTQLERTGALGFRMWEPIWSPDNSRIIFTFVRYYNPPNEEAYRSSHISWVPVDGGEPRFYSNSGTEYQPRLSPDGNWLVYVSVQTVTEGNDDDLVEPETKPELWLVGFNGNDKQRLTSYSTGGTINPKWSPNGSSLSFLYEPFGNSMQIMVLPFDGASNPSPIHSQRAMILDYDWQPTGRTITAAIRGMQGLSENTLWELSVVQNDTLTRMIDEVALDYPRYSPDGRWLAFRQAYELAVFDTATQTMELFGDETLSNSPIIWSPSAFEGEENCIDQDFSK